jgi:hypothetical protein
MNFKTSVNLKSRSESTKPKISKQQYKKQQAYFLNSKSKHVAHQQPPSNFTNPSPIFIDTNFTSFQALPSNLQFNSVSHNEQHVSKPELILSSSSGSPQSYSFCADSPQIYLPMQSTAAETTNLVKNVYPSIEMIDYSSKCETMN